MVSASMLGHLSVRKISSPPSELNVKKRHFPFFAHERIDPPIGSGPANQMTLAPAPPAGSAVFQVNSSPNLESLALGESKPWKMQLTKTPPNFTTLTESDIRQCYLVVAYTLG